MGDVRTEAGARSMRPSLGLDRSRRRRRVGSFPRTIEVLEGRALLADGIAPSAGLPINATAGAPITNAVLATFKVTDSSGEPGSQWRALIGFGDGQFDRLVAP